MIAPNPNLLCKEAELYYCDFLCDESCGLIPESIINHVEQCQECREQINKLKAALSQAESPESEQKEVHSAVTTMLKLHFAYIGKPVTCNIAKPFLPNLLEPALEIRIPTPIITHLHKCQQCAEDLDIIQCLNLNRKQLCRLSQLFADKPAKYNVSCQQAYAAVLTVLPIDFRETTDEVLKHVCLCPYCRKLLYEYREGARKKYMYEGRDQQFPCEEVSVTDIFDYVVPYGFDPANDQYVKSLKSFTSHAATCPNCLATMQQLHKTIYNIAERAESDIVTIYHVDESAKTEARSEPDDIYAGFPIRVETADCEGEVNAGRPASTIAFGAALKQKVLAVNLNSLAKTAIAAAALILIAVGLFLSTQTAKAVTIGEIYKALEKVKNVHISMFVRDKTEPIQEKWVSRSLYIYMTKSGKEWVLSDITKGVRKIKHLDTAVIDTERLTRDDAAEIKKNLRGFLGLMPFYNISEIPEDAEWSRVTDDTVKAADKDIQVYDLTRERKTYGDFVTFKKWRFFVDPETNLPQKTEFYKKLAVDDEYTRESVMVVEYRSDSEIRTVIKDAGF